MDPNIVIAAPDHLNLIVPEDVFATWATHVAFEARDPGPSYCFSAIPQGRGILPSDVKHSPCRSNSLALFDET
jgi:hypothetical protein